MPTYWRRGDRTMTTHGEGEPELRPRSHDRVLCCSESVSLLLKKVGVSPVGESSLFASNKVSEHLVA